MKVRDSLELLIRTVREFFQDQWFDVTRNVRTSGNVSLRTIALHAEDLQDKNDYQPARPAQIRRALREMPVRDVASYTYVDFGSGKGRSLFVAAELPFQEISGVEFSKRLHDQACANIRSFRQSKRSWCRNIRSLHQDATEYIFPEGPMVLYFFNPFGRETMQRVLQNLQASLRRNPRHVVVILLWPRWEDLVAGMEGMELRTRGSYYFIFEINRASAPTACTPRRQPGVG